MLTRDELLRRKNAFSVEAAVARLERETLKWCRRMLQNSPTALQCLKAALNADSGSWLTSFDIEDFVERSDDIARALKKADDAFYSVTFASKGSGQLTAIYDDAKAGVDLALREFDAVLGLLDRAGAPGVS